LTAGREGWLVPPGEPAALAAVIQQVLADPAQAAARAQSAQARALADFSLAKMVDQHLTLFEGLVR
jgi:starch synthase